MTSQEFVSLVNSDDTPWNQGPRKNWWTDSTKEQYFNLLNAEVANQHEIDMWRLNNEYNTPKAQMERMIEAGINPAAAYQNVSSGNASSAPGVHAAPAARWHDTTDKLAKVSSILNGISDIMSTINNGVSAIEGIQGIALTHQNNWYDQMRAQYFNGVNYFTPWLSERQKDFSHPVQVAPGLYADATQMQMFPEMYAALKDSWKGGQFDLNTLAREDQHALVERRDRMDKLVQEIFKKIESGASANDLLPLFLQVFTYGMLNKSGFGY